MAASPTEVKPLTIPSASNCILWMRPDDTSSSNMTSSANRLSAIKNLANNRVLISNGTTANQPSTGLVTINGLNALGFDNDNNRWLTTGIPASLTNFTVFAVVQQVVSGAQGVVFGGSSTNQVVRMTVGNTGFNSTDGTTGLSITAGVSVLTAPAIFAVTANASTSTRNLYKNSATIGTTGTYDGSISATLFGAATGSTGNARGGFNLGETIIYNKALSATEITTIMQFLSNRSGVILT